MPTTLNLAIPAYKLADVGALSSFPKQSLALAYFIDELKKILADVNTSGVSGVVDPVFANPAAVATRINTFVNLYCDEDGNPFDPTIGTVIP